AAVRPAEEIEQHVVVEHAAIGVEPDAIENVHHRTDLDDEARLLPHLARDRDLERLAALHRPARQAPLAFQRFVRAAHEQHATAVDDDGAYSDDWTLRIAPRVQRVSSRLRAQSL